MASAKFFSAGQARNNKTSRLIPVGVEVSQDPDKAAEYIDKVNAALMKAFPNLHYRIEPSQHNGNGHARQKDMYFWYLKIELAGPARDRLDFINFCKVLAKQYKKNRKNIEVWTENRKDGAHVSVSGGIGAMIQASANVGNVSYDDVDEFIDDVIEKYGEHIEVQPGSYDTQIIYR